MVKKMYSTRSTNIKKIVNFVVWKKTVTEMLTGYLKYNEKLPYLNKITKRSFLVGNKNMGLFGVALFSTIS